ncbi:MAG: hypothetical protein IKQ07_08555 [Bacteroidaceae bacterium]|nr:hypothetical protein [Bacteroidaceae bacterium]
MKKILLLFCTLLTAVGAWAQPNVSGKTFKLNCARGYVYGTGTKIAGTTDASQASEFAFVGYEGSIYLYDATNKAFVCHTTAATASTTGNFALESNSDFSKAVKGVQFGATNFDNYPWYLEETQFGNWLNMDGSRNAYFNTWKDFEGANGGNTYQVEIVNANFNDTEAVTMLRNFFNPEATVQYYFIEPSVYSDKYPAKVGDVINTLPSELQHAYCSYTVVSETVKAGENIVRVSVTYKDLPFELSTDYAHAKWYVMSLRGKWLSFGESTPYQGSDTYDFADEKQQWAFMGNPYALKIINKAAGEGMYLGYDNAANNVSPYMKKTEKVWEGTWDLDKNNNGFVLRMPENNSIYLHLRTPNLSTCSVSEWSAVHNDAGSTLAVIEVPDALVDVTYKLVVDGQTVNTVVASNVAANSEIAIPDELTEGYSDLGYQFTTRGTIGTSNCTITVTATPKSKVVTSLSQLSNTKAYTLTTARGSLGTNGTHLVSTVKDGFSASTFAIINYNGNYYLYSVKDSKFLLSDQLTDNASVIDPLVITAMDTKPLFYLGLGNMGINVSGGYESGVVVNSWTTPDPGNQYVLVESQDFDPTNALAALGRVVHVTYQVIYDGEVVGEAQTVAMKGDAPELPAELNNALFNYSTNVTAITGGNVIKYTATWNGPFVISESDDNPTWYYLRLKNENFITYNPSSDPNVQSPVGYTPNDKNAEWAFFGNPYKGLTLVNRGAGNNYMLGSPYSSDDGNNGGNTYATLSENVQQQQEWIPVASTYYPGGFFLFNTSGQALNLRSTENLAYWTGGNDAGSTFRVEEVFENYYPLVEKEVLPFIATGAPTDVLFSLPSYVVKDIRSQFAKQLNAKDFNYEDYQWCLDIISASLIYPEDGKYYLIKNVNNGNYLNVQKNKDGIFADQDLPLASTVVKAVVREDNTYFATQGLERGWCHGADNPALLDANGGGKYVHFSVSGPGQVAFALALGNGVGNYAGYLADAYYTVNAEGLVVGGKATDENAQWTFEEAKDFNIYTIEDKGWSYATFYAPFDVTLSNATAYKVAVTNGVAVPTELGRNVPAGTPVLVVSPKNVMTVKATVGFASSNVAEVNAEGNELVGSYLAAQGVTDGVLGDQGSIGFYLIDHETMMPANFASLPGGDCPLDKTTGIATLASALNRQPSAVYDLAGRRVLKAQKGIYISNGKKAVIK